MSCRTLESIYIDTMTPTASPKQENAVRDLWERVFTAQHDLMSMYLQCCKPSASSDAYSDDTGGCGDRRAANTQVMAFPLPTLPDGPKPLSGTRSPEPESIEYVTPTEETKEVHARRPRSMCRVAPMACGHHELFDEATCEPDQCIVEFAETRDNSPSTRWSDEDILEADRRFLDEYDTRQDMWRRCTAESTKMSPDDDDNDNHFGFCRAALQGDLETHLKEKHLEKPDQNRHEQNKALKGKRCADHGKGTKHCGSRRRSLELHATRQSSMNVSTRHLWKAIIRRTCNPEARVRNTGQCRDSLEPRPDGQDVLTDRCFLRTAQDFGVGFAK
ncbi:hypothetical protein EDD36DRAFT_121099 [Exophiala viscosa]|uniref:Uncharacterized protein n=1 Tax=Exophiala viscosa TaxID=2486360 RepID=A0AAN6E0H8_9EURO|nr:hypothetical protein EDD36DRAFT_121099 [Exophiala viscosa]